MNYFQWHVECKSILNLESIKWIKWKWKFVGYLCLYAFWARGIKNRTSYSISIQFFSSKKTHFMEESSKKSIIFKANYSNCKCIFPIEWSRSLAGSGFRSRNHSIKITWSAINTKLINHIFHWWQSTNR